MSGSSADVSDELKTLESVLVQERADARTRGTRTESRLADAEWETVARVLLNLDEFVTRE